MDSNANESLFSVFVHLWLSLSLFLSALDSAGHFGRLAASGTRTGLQVTEGVIYATITLGTACFQSLTVSLDHSCCRDDHLPKLSTYLA